MIVKFRKHTRTRPYVFATILIMIGLLFPGKAAGISLPVQSQSSPAQALTQDTKAYLPVVSNSLRTIPATFGLESYSLNATLLDRTYNIKTRWLRYAAISWKAIEPVRLNPRVYDWSMVDEAGLLDAASRALNVIAVIKYTPTWAQKYEGYSCGPVSAGAMDEFVDFISAVVSRYSAPPYNIHHWEIGNEPDVDPYQFSWDPNTEWNFGCWGDNSTPYYGGVYYGNMLKQVYPAIKAADPKSKVLIGGLLLYCDPTHPPAGEDCKPSKFFEGILRNQNFRYFDYVSYHGYSYFANRIVDEDHPVWAHRGGVVLGKADFLREVMEQYNIDKPIFHTEAALTCHINSPCDTDPVGTGFYEAQADYIVWAYVRNWATDISGTIWFSLENSWLSNGLLYSNLTPKPAYYAFQFMAKEIGDAVFVQPVTLYPELRAYEFSKGTKRIWVMWAPDQSNHVITLPMEITAVYDKYGTQVYIPPGEYNISVNRPIYVELTP